MTPARMLGRVGAKPLPQARSGSSGVCAMTLLADPACSPTCNQRVASSGRPAGRRPADVRRNALLRNLSTRDGYYRQPFNGHRRPRRPRPPEATHWRHHRRGWSRKRRCRLPLSFRYVEQRMPDQTKDHPASSANAAVPVAISADQPVHECGLFVDTHRTANVPDLEPR